MPERREDRKLVVGLVSLSAFTKKLQIKPFH